VDGFAVILPEHPINYLAFLWGGYFGVLLYCSGNTLARVEWFNSTCLITATSLLRSVTPAREIALNLVLKQGYGAFQRKKSHHS